jgi:signal-transduction protein with cAMP-binding, CBS, and nucleotidyltransferase domain
MTESPTTMSAGAWWWTPRAMREHNIGDVVVLEDSRIYGIVTDRDIVVRGVAQAKDPAQTKLADICSRELTTVSPNDEVADAVRLMKEKAIRPLPVVENERPVGIMSIGDLAVEQDRRSALGETSGAARPLNPVPSGLADGIQAAAGPASG